MQFDKDKKISYEKQNPKLSITANCRRAIWEMPRYQWSKFPSRSPLHGQLRPKVLKRDDHMCDAIRYAFTYIPDVKPELEFKPRPKGLTARDLLKPDEKLPDPFNSSFPQLG